MKNILENKSFKDEEIIIVDGNKTSTSKLIKYENIKKISSQKGRANQMNKGASQAHGDVLLFLHVDTLLPQNAFIDIQNILTKKEIVAGAFDLSFDNKSFALKLISYFASNRSRVTRLPYGDQAIFIKKEIFKQIGGYSDIRLMEDVNLMQKLKKAGYKIEISKQQVVTSSRKWDEKGIFYTTLRNWILICMYLFGVNPDKLAKFYK